MASPRARGLFRKAIGQNGAYWDSEHGSISTRSEAHARGRKLLTRMGVLTVADLRALPAAALHKATPSSGTGTKTMLGHVNWPYQYAPCS
jgi:para-nitrobenzyl esterase